MNSLGINKSKETKVVVAMSGGVDSQLSSLNERRRIRCDWNNTQTLR